MINVNRGETYIPNINRRCLAKKLLFGAMTLLLPAMVLTGIASAQTPVLSVSFQESGTGLGVPTPNWNAFTGVFNIPPLLAETPQVFTGTDSNNYTVGIAYAANASYNGFNAGVNGLYGTPPPNNYIALYSQGVFENAGTNQGAVTLSIAGVTPGATYSITLFSYNQGTQGTDTVNYAPTGSTVGTGGSVTYTGGYNIGPTTDTADSTTFNVTSTTSTLTIQVTAASGCPFMNGFTLTPVASVVTPPVPAASWLLDDGSGTTPAAMHGGSTLNGTFTASSGNVWNTSVPSVSGYVSGQPADKSLTFNGNGAVSVPDNAAIDPASVSVSAWIKTSTTTSSTYGIVQKELSSGGYLLYLSSGKVGFKVQNSGGTTYTALGTTTVANGAWHLVTGTFAATGGALKIYVDGALQTTTTGATMATTTQPLYIAGANNSAAKYFIGSIDEPAVYNYALSSGEVSYRNTHSVRPVFPEDYGALGNGSHDDTVGFQRAAQAIENAGGGTIALNPSRASGKVYLVGEQANSNGGGTLPYYRILNPYAPPGYSTPSQVLAIELAGLPGAFCLLGQTATMKLNAGLHFGGFDPGTGAFYAGDTGTAPNTYSTGPQYINYVGYCILLIQCYSVQIRDLTVDGNLSHLATPGGYCKDPGIFNIPAEGIYLDLSIPGAVGQSAQITNCTFQNHNGVGLDIEENYVTSTSPPIPYTLTNVTCNYNGMVGLNLSGGNSITVTGAICNNNGMLPGTGGGGLAGTPNPVGQAPACGMDIEGQGGPGSILANGTFTNCQFEDNAGIQVPITATGNMTFNNCTFWASMTGTWSLLDQTTPEVICNNCTFYGLMENDYGATTAATASQFNNCTFADNPSPATYPVTPSQFALVKVYISEGPSGPLIGPTFSGCTFDATKTPGFYLDTIATFNGSTMTGGTIFTNCNITHAWTGYDWGVNTNIAMSMIEGAELTNTHFYEAAGMPASTILGANVWVNSGVTVQGPSCLWYGGTVHSGTIPVGMYGPY